jgi:hypothetical protein
MPDVILDVFICSISRCEDVTAKDDRERCSRCDYEPDACSECAHEVFGMHTCEGCSKTFRDDCLEGIYCDDCGGAYCDDCKGIMDCKLVAKQ